MIYWCKSVTLASNLQVSGLNCLSLLNLLSLRVCAPTEKQYSRVLQETVTAQHYSLPIILRWA